MTSKILRAFKAFDIAKQSIINYEIKFIEPKNFEEAISQMKNYFLPYEKMNRSRKLEDDPKAVEDVLKMWRKILEDEKISIGCFHDEKLVGANFLNVKRKNDKEMKVEITSKNFRDIFDTLCYVESQFNLYDHYKIDSYLGGFGVSVTPAYRGRGIAAELLKAREDVARVLGQKLTSALFTGNESQRAAEKAGYEENFAIKYGNLAKINQNFKFDGIEEISMKIMSLKVN